VTGVQTCALPIFILNLELISRWAKWKTGVSWPGAGLFTYQYPVLFGLAIALGLFVATYVTILYRQFRRGQRGFLFSINCGKIPRLLRVGLALSVIIMWWLYGFTGTFDPQARMLWLPEPFLYVSVLATLLSFAVITGNLFPRQKNASIAQARAANLTGS
jgi:hypothetical protein